MCANNHVALETNIADMTDQRLREGQDIIGLRDNGYYESGKWYDYR